MSNLFEKTELLLHVLKTIPNSRDIVDVKIEGRGQGILFTWSYINEGIGAARFQAENKGLYVQVLQMVDDTDHQLEGEAKRPSIPQKTALAFFVQQFINSKSKPADQHETLGQMAIREAEPADLRNAASLAIAIRADIETRLRNNDSIDRTLVLNRLITLFEQFEL